MMKMNIEIDKIFTGKTVTIVGSGPSLRGFDFSCLQHPIIGVNHSPKFHEADMLVAIDGEFHKREKEFLDSFKGLKVTYNDTIREDFIKVDLEVDYDIDNLNLDWHILKANLSGYFALAIALELGAGKVYLIGFDGGYEGDNPNFHEFAYRGPGMNYYDPVNRHYNFFTGHKIINVGLDSKIDAFKKVPLNTDFYELGKV